jgi:hypothetical protein
MDILPQALGPLWDLIEQPRREFTALPMKSAKNIFNEPWVYAAIEW